MKAVAIVLNIVLFGVMIWMAGSVGSPGMVLLFLVILLVVIIGIVSYEEDDKN